VRLKWTEGQIYAGLGQYERALLVLEEAREGFAQHGIGYDVALVSLEIATVLLKTGRAAEVQALTESLVAAFQMQEVHREALAALALFQQGVLQQRLDLELVQRVSDFLRRSRFDPALVFEPAPLGVSETGP
jgi:hypothetical protein